MFRFIFLPIALLISSVTILPAQSWQDLQTVENVCQIYPDQMEKLLANLDLDAKGLEKVKEANEAEDIEGACKFLLEYYQNGQSASFLRSEKPAESDAVSEKGEVYLKDIITAQLVSDQVPRLASGQLDWNHKGPENDDEWAWFLNRHFVVTDLLSIYHETGNPRYARYIDSFIKDWIISGWPYPGVKSSTSMWRGLEVSFRVKAWSKAFYGLINTEYLSPATQLLILSSMVDHAHYMRNFHSSNNWLTMEISGLATLATAWKEFRSSQEWIDYAKVTMIESMRGQVYPDGLQTELTSMYHYVALSNFMLFESILKNAGEKLPQYFTKTMEEMYDYLAYSMRPDGHGILNNDADRRDNRVWVESALGSFDRDDWRYLISNGASGTIPEKGPSVLYPWGGQLISKSDFGSDAHWSFFDVGPWGSGHQHNDKLHVSVSAYGRDLLVDAGRFAYRGEVARKFRTYAKGTQGHNAVLIDGVGQKPGPKLAEQPLPEIHWKITPEFDYAWNTAEEFYSQEEAIHSRSLFYVRGKFWVIVDKIELKEPASVETLWHWHPECTVETGKNNEVKTTNERGNLSIIPVGDKKWNISTVKAQEDPVIQGWYSEQYNQFEPSTTTIYEEQTEAGGTNVWLLIPSEKKSPVVKSEIVSQDASGIVLRVDWDEKNTYKLTIPYADSNGAKLEN